MTKTSPGGRFAAGFAAAARAAGKPEPSVPAKPTKAQRKAAVELPRPRTAMADAVTKAAVKKSTKQAAATGISVNAERFRIAAMGCSTDASRYYLAGVYCEPHAKGGVNLVATDGTILVHIHDPEGSCAKPVILGLNKATLHACKRDKEERGIGSHAR